MKATIEFDLSEISDFEKVLVTLGVKGLDLETHTLTFENYPLQQLPHQGDVITKRVKNDYGSFEIGGVVSFVHFFLDEDGSETYYINVDCEDDVD